MNSRSGTSFPYGPNVMSTGNCLSPSGRYTFARRIAPSRIGTAVSCSTSIPYRTAIAHPPQRRASPVIIGVQIKLKSWRDDVTGHIPERQYLPHLLNPDPMRVTFPLEKATSVGHHVDVLRRVNNGRPPHLYHIVMGNAALCITAKSFGSFASFTILLRQCHDY